METGLFGNSDSFGDVPDQNKETLPEIEDVVDDDNSDLNIPKIEEDAQNDLGNLTLISSFSSGLKFSMSWILTSTVGPPPKFCNL